MSPHTPHCLPLAAMVLLCFWVWPFLHFTYVSHIREYIVFGWMASLTQWTWVWVNSRRWWWTWRPGVLQFMGSQRVISDWEKLNWLSLFIWLISLSIMNSRSIHIVTNGRIPQSAIGITCWEPVAEDKGVWVRCIESQQWSWSSWGGIHEWGVGPVAYRQSSWGSTMKSTDSTST